MKITRSTFTRKALTFGIVVFMSVALVASGFAAWLISSGSKAEGDGAIKVEVVDHANIKINVDNLVGDSLSNAQINFAPSSGDHSGYITGTATSSELGGITLNENLTFDVTGDITNGDKVGTLTFSLKVADGVAHAAGFYKEGDLWKYDASKAYITVPSYTTDLSGNALPLVVDGEWDGETYTEAIVLTVDNDSNVDVSDDSGNFNYKYNSGNGKYEFTATYVFGWGVAVGNENPGESLDALDNKGELPACVLTDGQYDLKKAELVIRLINAIVSEEKVGGVDAYTIDLSELDAATIDSYIAELDTMQADMNGASYTVVISALPKA